MRSKRINSIEKGKRGERLWCKFLRGFGFTARRGKQYSGNEDSEDTIHDVPGVWFEVKFRERLNIWEAYAQAVRDAPVGVVPTVAFTKNGERWMITLDAEDFIKKFRLKLQYTPKEGGTK